MFNRNAFTSMMALTMAFSMSAHAQTAAVPQPKPPQAVAPSPAQPSANQAQIPMTPQGQAKPTAPAQSEVDNLPKATVQHNPPSREAARIAEINERIAVMSAQLAELEMQSKIYAKRNEIEKSHELSRGLSMGDNFIPSVKEINGIDGKIWAVLNVGWGNTQTVRVGDRVGPWVVSEILPDSVTVRRGNDKLRLSFGMMAQQQPSATTAAPMNNGLPPLPGR